MLKVRKQAPSQEENKDKCKLNTCIFQTAFKLILLIHEYLGFFT